MLLLFSYIFISVGYVFGVPNTIDLDNYEITVDDGVLKSVHFYNSTATEELIFDADMITGIDKNAFENASEILEIDLYENNFTSLPQSVFSPLKHLNTLSMSKNGLSDANFLINVSATLEFLSLDFNNLSSLSDSAFAHFTNLKELSLVGSKLENINFTGSLSPTLEELDLQFNQISELPPGSFRHLNQLDTLNLRDNHITRLVSGAFDGLANIRVLNLNGNQITAIDGESFKGLENTFIRLSLSFNKIERLNKGTFNLTRARALDLSRNHMSEIEKGTFNMSSLEWLSLESNWLTTLNPESFMGLPQLRFLNLQSNPTNVSERERYETLSNRSVLVRYR